MHVPCQMQLTENKGILSWNFLQNCKTHCEDEKERKPGEWRASEVGKGWGSRPEREHEESGVKDFN